MSAVPERLHDCFALFCCSVVGCWSSRNAHSAALRIPRREASLTRSRPLLDLCFSDSAVLSIIHHSFRRILLLLLLKFHNGIYVTAGSAPHARREPALIACVCMHGCAAARRAAAAPGCTVRTDGPVQPVSSGRPRHIMKIPRSNGSPRQSAAPKPFTGMKPRGAGGHLHHGGQ
jgi:hypothetical protein